MAKVVICPSCQSKGSIPDEAQVAKFAARSADNVRRQGGASRAGPAPGTVKRPASVPRQTARRSGELGVRRHGECPAAGAASKNRGIRRAPSSGPAPTLKPVRASRRCSTPSWASAAPSSGCCWSSLHRRAHTGRGQGRCGCRKTSGSRRITGTQSSRDGQPLPSPAVTAPSYSADASRRPIPRSSISAEIVRRLKDATVYIKNKIAGKTLASGTGFVIEVRGDTVILATNRHVAVFDISELPAQSRAQGKQDRARSRLPQRPGSSERASSPCRRSSPRTPRMISAPTWRFLAVKGVKQPPTPINVLAKSDTTEGMAYTGAGFPFGGMLGKVNRRQRQSLGHDHRRPDRGACVPDESRAARPVPG